MSFDGFKSTTPVDGLELLELIPARSRECVCASYACNVLRVSCVRFVLCVCFELCALCELSVRCCEWEYVYVNVMCV